MEWYFALILGIEVIISYFVGNISFARIISKHKHGDITKVGSGNPGSTNMLRIYGAKTGFLTLFLDIIKGVIPSLMGFLTFYYTMGNSWQLIGLYSCGLATVVGHMFPVVYKFKGGKGVATTLGVFAVADPLIMLIVFAGAFVYVLFFEYVSVASLLIVTAMSIVEVYKIPDDATSGVALAIRLLIFVMFTLVWFAHRANIQRLLVGKENKANLKKALKKILKQEKKERKQEKKAGHKQQKAIKKSQKKTRKMEAKELKKLKKSQKRELRAKKRTPNPLNRE